MTNATPPLVRSAFWIGTIQPGEEANFRAQIDQGLISSMRRVPGVASASVLWPNAREGDPPEIVCQVLLEFASRADLEKMMASSERQEAQAQGRKAAQWFEGKISHIEFETLGR